MVALISPSGIKDMILEDTHNRALWYNKEFDQYRDCWIEQLNSMLIKKYKQDSEFALNLYNLYGDLPASTPIEDQTVYDFAVGELRRAGWFVRYTVSEDYLQYHIYVGESEEVLRKNRWNLEYLWHRFRAL